MQSTEERVSLLHELNKCTPITLPIPLLTSHSTAVCTGKARYVCSISIWVLKNAGYYVSFISLSLLLAPPTHLATLNITYPMLFRLSNPKKNRQTHCGVLEFCAEEGRVYVPHWVCDLALQDVLGSIFFPPRLVLSLLYRFYSSSLLKMVTSFKCLMLL